MHLPEGDVSLKEAHVNLQKFPYSNFSMSKYKTVIIETDENLLRCCKVKLTLSHKQRLILRRWFELYRFTYNKTIKLIRKQGYYKSSEKNKISFYSLRKHVKDSFTIEQKQHIKNSKIPMHTLDNAIRDVCKAYKTAFTLLKKKKIKYFHLRTKKESSPKETLVLESSCFSKKFNSFAVRVMGKSMKSSVPIKGIDHDSRLQLCKRTGKLTLFVPINKIIKDCTGREEWCSLDPGIRTFQTLYSPTGIEDFGTDEPCKIKKIIKQIEKLKGNEGKGWYKCFSNKRYKKIQNIRDDLHWKTALQLVTNYDMILIGSMSTKGIVSKKGNLNKQVKTVANMLSHYLFRQRLEAKAEEYGAEVIVVNEAWTSKTCGSCFHVHHNLGGSKTFDCPRPNKLCSFKLDRDVNGARNIALKHFGLFEPIY